MAFQADAYNCGLQILQGLSGISDTKTGKINELNVYILLRQFLSAPAMGLCNFSDNVDNHDNANGRILAKIIQDNNLGDIIAGPVAPNPAHFNQTHIQSWSWAVNMSALKKYLDEHEPQQIKDQKARAEKAKLEAEEKKKAALIKQAEEDAKPEAAWREKQKLKEQEITLPKLEPAKPMTPAQAARKMEWSTEKQREWIFAEKSKGLGYR